MKRMWVLALSSAWLAACSCGTPARPCTTTNDCPIDSVCVQGRCQAGGTGGGQGGGITFGGGTGTGGGGGGIGPVTGCNPSAPDNLTRDTDCDGLSDAEEYGTDFGGGAHTDPCLADSDGDGVLDGVEVGKTTSPSAACTSFAGDPEPRSKTNPTLSDTDGDGLKDGEEDANKDGRIDGTESDPSRKDSDCDGYSDFDEVRSSAAGCATSPVKKDTDGDGLQDGVEGGLQPPGADVGCNYVVAITFDAEAATKTNACSADTDGDGIMDGAEDSNLNGRVDTGELNPLNPADGQGPAQSACATANLRPINFHTSGLADTQVALVPEFAEVSKLTDSGEKGIIFYDNASKIAGLILSKAPAGGDGTAEENFGRGRIGSTGTVSGPITQTFTTWDGFAGSVRATYDLAGNTDVKTRINDIARAFLGAGVQGVLAGAGGAVGPYKVQAEYIRRTATRAVVLVAIIPTSSYTGQNLFRIDDVGNGTATAQFGDFAGTQCEVFAATVNAKVDFVWAVDDSCSMAGYQAAIGNAATAFSAKLATAGLDWRVGATTTGYYRQDCTPGTSPYCYRNFTTSTATMQTWFNSSGGSAWFGTSGDASETGVQSARDYLAFLLPKTTNPATNKIRTDASVHVILLGDADDQAPTAIGTLNNFFNNYDGAGGKATVHGIVCPQGQSCGETQANPRRNLNTIAATGGVLGDINVAQNNSPQLAATIDAILSAAIGGTGKQLQRPPISATIKVAMETGRSRGSCNTADVPRDRANGWDIDPATRRIVFYGNCIPAAAGVQVAISYKYWNDASPDPNGDPCGATCVAPLVCDPNTKSCVCPATPPCGGCGAGLTCDMNTCSCSPGIG